MRWADIVPMDDGQLLERLEGLAARREDPRYTELETRLPRIAGDRLVLTDASTASERVVDLFAGRRATGLDQVSEYVAYLDRVLHDRISCTRRGGMALCSSLRGLPD